MHEEPLLCWLVNPPGDVEEREANAVFDEDGEVIHIQHRTAGKGNRRRRVRRTGRGFWDLRAPALHVVIFPLSWTPSLDFTLALGAVGTIEADSRNCTCVTENRERRDVAC